MTEATLIILASDTGRESSYQPVPVADVPAWLKAPDVMGKLVAGHECMKADEGDKGSKWYRAVTPEQFKDMARTLH